MEIDKAVPFMGAAFYVFRRGLLITNPLDKSGLALDLQSG